ncbi:MAG: tail fiber domain-containing protein, partial [Planctomycetota bacterium]
DDEPTFGVIAQEVAEVMPHAVGQRDGYLTVDYSIIGGR